MSKIKSIISDADGTLVDTVELIRRGQFEAAKKYLTEHGLKESDIPNYEKYTKALNKVVGGPAKHTQEETFKLLFNGREELIKDIDFDKLLSHLKPIQDELAPRVVRAYDGLSKTLFYLGENNIKLAIFTSGRPHHIVRNFSAALPELEMEDIMVGTEETEKERLKEFTHKFKDHFNLPSFDIVTCKDTNKHKPEPESLLLAMEKISADTKTSLVLGDHKVDMQAAKNAGIGVRVGITHGFDDEKELLEAGATDVIHSLPELIRIINE